MAHTPGEWFYDRRTESIGFPSGWLGSTKGREGEGLGDQHDDGQLMAAAPRLLAACEVQYSKFGNVPDTLEALAGLLDNGDLYNTGQGWAIVLWRIAEEQRAAIAAARGTGE